MTALDTITKGSQRGRSALWFAAALAVFVICLVTPFSEVWQHDLTEAIPLFPRDDGPLSTWEKDLKPVGYADQQFVTWGVARNARALLTQPTGLFDAEHCYPASNTLALSEPMITLGIAGTPAYLLTRDPVALVEGSGMTVISHRSQYGALPKLWNWLTIGTARVG